MAEIHTLEKLAQVKRTIVDVVAPGGSAVLNAADPLVAEMASHCQGSVVFFARDPHNPVLAAHRARGGRGVFVRQDAVVLADGEHETVLIPLARVPLTHGGRIDFQVENVLAASAAAWALGIRREAIVDVLEVFTSDIQQTPGRFNVLYHGEATVVLDYGHNASALLALVDAIAAFPHRRRLTVFTAAGDRRDEDIIRQGEIIGEHFDFVILYEDACRRGRADGVVTALIRQGLCRSQRVSGTYETRGEVVAVEDALGRLRPGDLLYIQPDQVDLSLGFVQNYLATHPPVVSPEESEARLITAR
jgi:cyanophycin synthetase